MSRPTYPFHLPTPPRFDTARPDELDHWAHTLTLALNEYQEESRNEDAEPGAAGAPPRYHGILAESRPTINSLTYYLAVYHVSARRLFWANNVAAKGGLDIFERAENRWNELYNSIIAPLGGGVVTMACYVPKGDGYVWISTDGSEEIYEYDRDGTLTNTFSMAGCVNLRSADCAYIDVFPDDPTDLYVYVFEDGGAIYQLSAADGSIVNQTADVDCKQMVLERVYGNRFRRGWFVRSSGDISMFDVDDLDVTDPADLTQATTSLGGSEWSMNYNDVQDRVSVIGVGETTLFTWDPVPSAGAAIEASMDLTEMNNAKENYPYIFASRRHALTSDAKYLEVDSITVVTGHREARGVTWSPDCTMPKNLCFIEHDNGEPAQHIREAVCTSGSAWHVLV